MSTETQPAAATPPEPPPAPKVSVPESKENYGIALAMVWGSAMLAVFALWLGKFVPPEPTLPTGLADLVAQAPPTTIQPPPTWLLALLWAMCGISLIRGVWFAMSTFSFRTDTSALKAMRRPVGWMLLGASVPLAFAGLFLVFQLKLSGFAESVGLSLFALIPLFGGLALMKSPGSRDVVSVMLPLSDILYKVLFLVGGAGLFLFFWLRFRFGLTETWLPELGAITFFSLMCITVGFRLLTYPPGQRTLVSMRVLLIILGGGTGLIIFLEALFRTLYWREQVLFGGMPGWLGNDSWKFWLCAYTGLIGLALMFASTLLARSEVRTQPKLRQALYGYNAVASSLLVVAFLAAGNVLANGLFPLTQEWSDRGLVSLSPATKTQLNELRNKPAVTVYVLLSSRSVVYSDMKHLLDNCQAAAPVDKFHVKYVSPESDLLTYDELVRRFPVIAPGRMLDARRGETKGRGVLLVFGPMPKDDNDPVPQHDFISDRKLMSTDRDDQGHAKRSFQGEVELCRTLQYYMRGQKKHRIYLLQGNNELAMNEKNGTEASGAGVLVDRLVKDNYEVKGLNFNSPNDKKEMPDPDVVFVQESGPDSRKDVPKDAWAVMVLGAEKKLPKETLEALDRYMDRPEGRMIVTLELYPTEDRKRFKRSGVEDLLKKFGVQAEEEYVVRYEIPVRRNPYKIVTLPPRDTQNELALKFRNVGIELAKVRVVRPITGTRFKVEVLLEAAEEDGPFLVDKDVDVLVKPGLYFSENHLLRMRHLKEDTAPVAVTVSELSGAKDDKTKPRMVVFGNTDFVSNPALYMGDQARLNYSLVASSLDWMGERPVPGVQARDWKFYGLRPNAQLGRMRHLPLWFMTLGILGLGTGVWLVRRR